MDNGHNCRWDLIKELQEQWTCNVHTHGNNPIYCYTLSNNGAMCYPLTIMRLGMWATEIVHYNFLATPPTSCTDSWTLVIRWKMAQPQISWLRKCQTYCGLRFRILDSQRFPCRLEVVDQVSGVNPGQQPPYSSQTGAYGYYPPPAAAPVIIMQPTPWGAPIQAADSPWYPYQPAAQPFANLGAKQQSLSLETQSSNSHSHSPANFMATGYTDPHPSPHTHISSIDNLPDSETSEIIAWFTSLYEHEAWKKDYLKFTTFGKCLYDEGFWYLSQLFPSMLSLKELAASMGTSKGNAVFVRHYAKQDLEALLSRWSHYAYT